MKLTENETGPAVAEPAGWKLVPLEPTWGLEAMSGAGSDQLPAEGCFGSAGQIACNVYRAMVAAAPAYEAALNVGWTQRDQYQGETLRNLSERARFAELGAAEAYEKLERLRADPLSSLDAYSKGFEEGGRVERERADFLEAKNERLRATLEKIAGSHDERVGHCRTDMADVPDCSAEEAMKLARAAIDDGPDSAEAVIEAARCIRHWHDTHDGGMIVSGDHVRKLWEALDRYDSLPAPKPHPVTVSPRS